MRVLVTGATGFVGKALIGRLLADQHQVSAWVRDLAAARRSLDPRVQLVEARAEALVDAVAGAEAVVNLAGEPIIGKRWTEAQKKRLVDSRVDLGRALATAISSASSRPSVMVSASATGYYGDRGDELLDETSAIGRGFLADLCRDWEAAPRAVEAHGVRLVTLRIGIVLGKGGGAMQQLLPLFRRGLGGPLAGGQAWWSWIHLQDLITLIVTALVDARYQGVINAVAPGAVQNKAMTETLARAVGKWAPFPVPGFALKALFGEGSQPMLDSARVRPRRLEELGFPFRYSSLPGALAEITGP
ncbi:MAG: TIGR01777 family oxidoreductase [Myxococcota bacterium]